MGRYSSPTAVKQYNGNPGNKTLPYDEPKPELIDDISPPMDFLFSDLAVAVWNEVAGPMRQAKMLAKTDRLALAALCNTTAEYFTAEKEVAAIIKSGKWELMGGGKGRAFSSRVSVRNEAEMRFRNGSAKFGLTPSDRVKLKQIDTQMELPFDVPETEEELVDTIQASAERLEEMGVVLPFMRKD